MVPVLVSPCSSSTLAYNSPCYNTELASFCRKIRPNQLESMFGIWRLIPCKLMHSNLFVGLQQELAEPGEK